MGQDKKQLTKLLAFVKSLYDDPDNKEFAAGIQAIVLNDFQTENKRESWTKQINEIYELCLMKNLREQAEDLYKDFPITSISSDLASLFVQMEDARRHNDFDAFGFNLYQQIELIVNTLIKETNISLIYSEIKELKPFTKYDKNSNSRVRVEDKKYSKAELFILIAKKEDSGELSYRSIGKQLASLSALEKARAIIYIVNKGCEVDLYAKNNVIQFFETLSSIYNVRNHDAHSGGVITEFQERQYQKLVADKTQNYLYFLSFLLAFLQGISANYPLQDRILALSKLS